MTRREHFEQWMKNRFPNMPLDHGEAEDFYYHDMVQFMWLAWQEAPLHRPTEGKVTKERLAELKADDPATIVDRLSGIYGTVEYPVSKVQKEAAREIERLRGKLCGNH